MKTLIDKRKEVASVYRNAFFNSYIHPDKFNTIKQILIIIEKQDKKFIEELKKELMIKQDEPIKTIDEYNKELFDKIDKITGMEGLI